VNLEDRYIFYDLLLNNLNENIKLLKKGYDGLQGVKGEPGDEGEQGPFVINV
jgi:hypothetical protein